MKCHVTWLAAIGFFAASTAAEDRSQADNTRMLCIAEKVSVVTVRADGDLPPVT